MDFGLLGPIVVRYSDAVLPIPYGKQRVILAVLLLRSGKIISAEDLMDLIWDGNPPPSARPALHNYIKRLRQALGEGGRARIKTTGPGYLIEIAPCELDLARFDLMCTAGREAAAGGKWEQSAAQLSAALSLWRDRPLLDIQCQRLTTSEVPPLFERKAQAIEEHIDASLHLGRHRRVIPELQQLISAEPLRERFSALLMLALYRAGRQADALAAYQATRRALIDELGVEPGKEVREMQQKILAADPRLDLPSEAAVPVGGTESRGGQRVVVDISTARRASRPLTKIV